MGLGYATKASVRASGSSVLVDEQLVGRGSIPLATSWSPDPPSGTVIRNFPAHFTPLTLPESGHR